MKSTRLLIEIYLCTPFSIERIQNPVQPLTNFAISSLLDVLQSFDYASEFHPGVVLIQTVKPEIRFRFLNASLHF